MRVFRLRTFSRWMRKIGLTDEVLLGAVREMAQGLIDADLGGCIVKKRVALSGAGKRGGARVLVATRVQERWFFLFGFNKNERATIDGRELRTLQRIAEELLGYDSDQLRTAIDAGEIIEVLHDRNQT